MSLAFSSSSSVLAGFFSFFSSFFFFVFFLSSSPPPLSSAFHGPQHLTIIEIGFLTLSLTPLFPDNLAPFPGFTLWNKTRTSFTSFRISVSLRLSLDCRGKARVFSQEINFSCLPDITGTGRYVGIISGPYSQPIRRREISEVPFTFDESAVVVQYASYVQNERTSCVIRHMRSLRLIRLPVQITVLVSLSHS